MNDIWRGSTDSSIFLPALWWASRLVFYVTGRAVFYVVSMPVFGIKLEASTAKNWLGSSIAGEAVGIVAAIALIILIEMVTRGQDRKIAMIKPKRTPLPAGSPGKP